VADVIRLIGERRRREADGVAEQLREDLRERRLLLLRLLLLLS
jgi:hypothetical protein